MITLRKPKLLSGLGTVAIGPLLPLRGKPDLVKSSGGAEAPEAREIGKDLPGKGGGVINGEIIRDAVNGNFRLKF